MNGNILGLIGNTPLVEIEENVFAKLEGNNLTGSIKDRIALAMIENAEKEGILSPGKTIVEPTSGNTGVSLALICSIKGYKLEVIMPETTSERKIKMIQAYGGKTVLIENYLFRKQVIDDIKERISKGENIVFLNQYENETNKRVHYNTTAEEIIQQMKDKPIDYFVAGVGTGGTISGIAKKLKEKYNHIKIIGVQPKVDTIIEGLKSIKEGYVPPILELDLIDEMIEIDGTDALEKRTELSKTKGLLVGPSSGAVMHAIDSLNLQGNIVTIFPDRGERYL